MIALGIDAGGTKTIFSLCDDTGRVLSVLRRPTIAYPQVGEEGQLAALREGAAAALKEAGISAGEPSGQLSAVCFGVPLWEESVAGDAAARRSMDRVFGAVPKLICSDAQVAWAGSFGLLSAYI